MVQVDPRNDRDGQAEPETKSYPVAEGLPELVLASDKGCMSCPNALQARNLTPVRLLILNYFVYCQLHRPVEVACQHLVPFQQRVNEEQI